jgi:DNA polymerase (family 10)
MGNPAIAQELIRIAHRLEAEGRSLYRIQAYRRAAETVLGLDRPLEAIVAENGARGLRELPGIGSKLAKKLVKLVQTGELSTLTASESAACGVAEG